MKKIISFMLAIVLILSVIPLTMGQAAEYIGEINLEIPQEVAGYTAYDMGRRCIKSNVGYVTVYAYDTENPDEAFYGDFVVGKTYLLEMYVEVWGVFLPTLTVSVNGKNSEFERWGKREVKVEHSLTVKEAKDKVPGAIKIDFAETLGNTDVISVKEGMEVDYDLFTWYYWVYEYGSDNPASTFVTGEMYTYRIFLVPYFGEAFLADKNEIDITINGKKVTPDMISYCEDDHGGIFVDYSFEAKYNYIKLVDRVDIKLNYPDKGEDIEAYNGYNALTKGVRVSTRAISDDRDGIYVLAEEEFSLLKDYYLYLYVETEYDYRFSDNVEFYCNGRQISWIYGEYNNDRCITIIIPLQDEYSYDTTNPTSNVEVTVPTNAGGLTVNNFIKGIESTSFVNTALLFDENGALVEKNNKMQTGKTYTAGIFIDSYGVFVLPSVKVNKKIHKNFEQLDRDTIYCEYTFVAKKADYKEHNNINIVFNENIGNIKYGKLFNMINVDIWNCNYYFDIEEKGSEAPVFDVEYIFETDKEYTLRIELEPHFSFGFPENIEKLNVYINGNKISAENLKYEGDNLVLEYNFIAKQVVLTDRVDITADNPHKGQYIDYYECDADEWLSLDAYVHFWGVSNSAETDYNETNDRKFKTNKDYYMHIYCTPDTNVVMADDIMVYVNGEYKATAHTDEYGMLKISYKLDVEKADFFTNIRDFFQWIFWKLF